MALTAISTSQFVIYCSLFPGIYWESCSEARVDVETATYNDGQQYISKRVAGNRTYPVVTLTKPFDPLTDPTNIVDVYNSFDPLGIASYSITIQPVTNSISANSVSNVNLPGSRATVLTNVQPVALVLPPVDRNATEVARISVSFTIERLITTGAA